MGVRLRQAVLVARDLAPVSERLRAELGLGWGPNRERLLGASRAMLRGALPLLPSLAREFPPARSADRRVRAAA